MVLKNPNLCFCSFIVDVGVAVWAGRIFGAVVDFSRGMEVAVRRGWTSTGFDVVVVLAVLGKGTGPDTDLDPDVGPLLAPATLAGRGGTGGAGSFLVNMPAGKEAKELLRPVFFACFSNFRFSFSSFSFRFASCLALASASFLSDLALTAAALASALRLCSSIF